MSSAAVKGPLRARLVDATMGYELDDVADRVVEVAGERVPVVEVEDDLGALRVG